MKLEDVIIYSDTLNETEFLRTLVKQGFKTRGLQVMNAHDLALFILTKLGKTKKGTFLSNDDQDFIYYSLLKPQCFNDASNIRSAINMFRDTGNGNSFKELDNYLLKQFVNKKLKLEEAFNDYNAYKKNKGAYDLYDLLYELSNNSQKIDVDVIYFEDLPFSSLAVSTFSKFFNLKSEKLRSLLGKVDNKPELVKCYGKNNEFSSLLCAISKNSIKLDEALVVLTDTNDITGLVNRFEQYGVDEYTSSIGFPFIQTNVGKLVAKIKAMKNMAYGVDAYRGLFNAPYFNKNNYLSTLSSQKAESYFIKYVGWLRPSFDQPRVPVNQSSYSQEMFDALNKICDDINDLDGKYFEFITNNVVPDKYDFEAKKLLEKHLEKAKAYNISFDDILDNLLSSYVGQHISDSGAIHVCSLEQAFSSLRENIFIIGLDGSFPGNPKENYLIYDEDFLKMNAPQCTSIEVVKAKKELMELLIAISPKPYLSYSYYSVIDTKDINPSSIIFELVSFFKKSDKNYKIPEFTYKDDFLSLNPTIIKEFTDGKPSETIQNINNHPTYQSKPLLDKEYSPSSFGDFFNNKLAFILSNIYEISVDEPDDPYVVINANDKGTLFHNTVKYFDKNKISEQDFVNKGLKAFDDFMFSRPAIIPASQAKERKDYEKGLRNMYRSDPGNVCIKAEYKISNCTINGVKFKGTFDRLEKNALNQYILVDYKTGTTLHHKANDTSSCIQGLLYAAMIKQEFNIDVEYCEFRYPFANDTVQISNNPTKQKELDTLILEFKDAITNHNFVCADEEYSYVEKYDHLISLIKELKN